MKQLLPLILLTGLVLEGCASDSGHNADAIGLRADTALPARTSSVVVDGCVLDAWQRSTLANPSAKRVLRGGEVIFLCLVPRADGTVGPRDPSSIASFAALAGDLRNDGYRVHLGVSFTDETGQRYDGAATRTFLAKADWRARFLQTIPDLIGAADGIDLDFQNLPNEAREDVNKLVQPLANAIRPTKKLGVFMPPSVASPSDLPGGDSLSRTDLAPYVDRMHISTLDYSLPNPGPTIDPGWAVDATRLALQTFASVDISFPLYGTDFGPRGPRSVTYAEAIATGARVERGPTGAPFVVWTGFDGEQHQTWFDDAESTGLVLGAWAPPTLPESVGVVFYGLGAEDPTLWDRLAARMP